MEQKKTSREFGDRKAMGEAMESSRPQGRGSGSVAWVAAGSLVAECLLHTLSWAKRFHSFYSLLKAEETWEVATED